MKIEEFILNRIGVLLCVIRHNAKRDPLSNRVLFSHHKYRFFNMYFKFQRPLQNKFIKKKKKLHNSIHCYGIRCQWGINSAGRPLMNYLHDLILCCFTKHVLFLNTENVNMNIQNSTTLNLNSL